MAIPFIVGGLIAAASAVAGKKAYDGYQDNSRAEEISSRAKRDYTIEPKNQLNIHKNG